LNLYFKIQVANSYRLSGFRVLASLFSVTGFKVQATGKTVSSYQQSAFHYHISKLSH